jgi:NADH-quinone oxidoreductase subunit A
LLADYLPIVMLGGLGALFAVASILIGSRVGPHNPSAAKDAPYECGITPVQVPTTERFPVKFYLVAMLFIIFDVEIVFLYPWAVIFRELRLFGLIEMAIFVGLALVAYFYILRRGGLDWEQTRRVVPPRGTVMPREALRSPGEGGAGRPSDYTQVGA